MTSKCLLRLIRPGTKSTPRSHSGTAASAGLSDTAGADFLATLAVNSHRRVACAGLVATSRAHQRPVRLRRRCSPAFRARKLPCLNRSSRQHCRRLGQQRPIAGVGVARRHIGVASSHLARRARWRSVEAAQHHRNKWLRFTVNVDSAPALRSLHLVARQLRYRRGFGLISRGFG